MKLIMLTGTLSKNGKSVHIRPQCAQLLGVLSHWFPKTVTYETIGETIWPHDADRPSDLSNMIAVMLHETRKRLEVLKAENLIEVIEGTGLRLCYQIEVDWAEAV